MAGQDTTDQLQTLVKRYYDKRLVERLEPKVNLYQWAEKRPIPTGNSDDIRFTSYRNLKPIMSDSGELSSTQAFVSSFEISKTLVQRHNYAQVSALLKDVSIDPRVEGIVDVIADLLAKTVEFYIRQQVVGLMGNALRSSTANLGYNTAQANINTQGVFTTISSQRTHQFYSPYPILHDKGRLASSAAELAATIAGSAATISQIRHAVSFLRARDAEPFDNGNYVFYCHPWVADVLMQDPNWENWNKNANSKETMWKGQIGSVFGADIVTSNMAMRYEYSAAPLSTASGAMNYSFIFGKQAYGVSELTIAGQNQKGFEIIIHQAGSAGTSDPANLVNTIAGKMIMAATVLNKSSGALVATTDKVVTSGT